jgi:hypothetical protein
MTTGDAAYDNRIPLVIGVTGHRDIVSSEQAVIKQRIQEFFEELGREYPDLPLLVMTPLAEGADRIAAEAAHELGIRTIVLLPMPQALYQRDFEGGSLEEFQAMRALGECIELPLLAELSEQDVLEPGPGRDLQYAQLGAYLAAHSHILLAVWDGRPSVAPGGTGHVIKFHQHDVIDLIAAGQHRSPIDFTEDESDLVYHIVCSRQDGKPAEGLVAGDAHWFTRDEVQPRTSRMPDRYRLVFERMVEFSRDLQNPQDGVATEPLIPAAALDTSGPGTADIDRLYRRADYMARRFQGLFYREIRWSAFFLLAAGCSFVSYADLPGFGFMIYPYIACIACVLLLVWVDRRWAWQRKFLDYRVLAEGLRVQFYWSLAGVRMDNPSRFSHDCFLERQDLELGWIRNLMRYAGFRADAVAGTVSRQGIELARHHWVHPQFEYYRRKSTERRSGSRVTGVIDLTSFMVVLAAAVGLALGRMQESAATFSIALMGLAPFVIAARQSYAFRLAERESLAQFQHSVRIFANAMGLMDKAPDDPMKLEILRALGEAALEEHSQWLLRQRERPVTAAAQIQG